AEPDAGGRQGDPRDGGDAGTAGWADIVHYLIARGHQRRDVMTYTLAQARAFAAAAARDERTQQRQQQAATAEAVRMAMGAEPAAFTKYLNDLIR
ncbi:hypothetical protein, partial [Xanthomonas vasicola]